MLIPLGPWLPDRPAVRGEPHCREALGCLPAAEGYEPLSGLVPQTEALPAPVTGGFAARDKNGGVHIYAGTASNLYELGSDATWTDVTRTSGGDYAGTQTTRWAFAAYGDRLIAANGVDEPQYVDMSTAGSFEDLPNAPVGTHVASMGGFVFAGNTVTSRQQLAWSAINDSESWTPGADQSDAVTFPDGGLINGLGAVDVLYVFQESAIRRVVYVGPPTVMQVDVLERGRGCIAPGSLAQAGRLFFYLSEDGFYVFDGGASQNIGAQAVNDWFRNDFDRGSAFAISSAIDPLRTIVAWAYVSRNSPFGKPDSLIFYNWTTGTWAHERITCERLLASLTLGYTLDGLTVAFPNIDAMTISLDDPVLTGGALRFAAFQDCKLAWFTGAARAARIETGDVQVAQTGRSLLRALYPACDASDTQLSVSAREAPNAAVVYDPAITMQSSGRVPARASGRWFRTRITIPEGAVWTYCNAIEWDAVPAGRR